MATITTTQAFALATEVAWLGHTSDGAVVELAAKAGIDSQSAKAALAAAVATGLLRQVPRLGGYVAGRKVNERIFGAEFAAFIAGEVA